MTIGAATRLDMPAVRALLERHQLPLDGVEDHVEMMVVARDHRHVVGAAALELYADGALLRSVAVDPAVQGRRIGQRLIETALQMARQQGVGTVYLLTTTAQRFFPRFGFVEITRADVPSSVQESIEFQSACPASAIVMRKHLAPLP